MSAPVHEGELLAGKYRVDQVLGEGGMGVVVAATDIQLERRVALKFLLSEYAQNQEACSRFLREARAAAKIRSEHVARVIDVGTLETGAPYLVMEYLEGSDLAAVMAAATCLSVEDATDYVLQACEAIAEAHARGIIHRDLKPANLFLSQEPGGRAKVKVLDFGISKTTLPGLGFEPALTKTSALMGSPLYMSPEQMRSTRNVDARTDIWALGVILYELLAQTPPFTGETVPELSAKVLLEQPPPLRQLRPDVPEQLEAVVLKALAKEPDDRFPSVAELAIALVRYAPKRARVTVENITKILRAAGLSTSALSLPPSVPTKPAALPPPTFVPQTGVQTAATWGATHGPEKRRGGWRWMVAGSVTLSVMGALVYLALLSPGSPGRVEQTRTPAGPSAAPASKPKELPGSRKKLATIASRQPASEAAKPIPAPSVSSAREPVEAQAKQRVATERSVPQPASSLARASSSSAVRPRLKSPIAPSVVTAEPPGVSVASATKRQAPAIAATGVPKKPSASSSKSSSSALPEFGKRK